MQDWIGRLLCLIGQHDFKVVEVTFGFGPSGRVEKVQCQRCGYLTTRSGEDQ